MTSSAIIRIAGPDDVETIGSLTRAAYAKWVAVLGRKPLPMTVDYGEAVRVHRFDLLCEGREVVGLIETVPADGHLLIVNVCTAPQSQGKGYGRRLMDHAERLAAQAGLAGVRLYTNALFTDNLRFYARLGYEQEREEPFRGGTLVHMVKRVGGCPAAHALHPV
jgi:ribosomal protein S18 acetylase RimI-like enzyme